MEMSIRITASLAPPVFQGYFWAAGRRQSQLTMQRTTADMGRLSATVNNIKRDTHYNDAHPALFGTRQPPT